MLAHFGRVLVLGAGWLLLMAGMAWGQDAANAPTVTLHQDVRLVSIDVLVTGKDGKPVRDLKPEDFTVTENGVVQQVLHAEGHFHGDSPATVEAGGSERAQAAVVARKGIPGVAAEGVRLSNRLSGGEAVWNLILLDGVNASEGNQGEARRQMLKFIKKLPADEPMALATMGSSLRVLTPFQAGAGGIDRVLAAGAANPQKPLLVEEYNPDDEAILEHIEARMPDKGAELIASRSTQEELRLDRRVETVVGELSDMTRWLERYPGRKNVFWLSTGFPLITSAHLMERGGQSGKSQKNSKEGAQTALDEQMQLAHVSIFPIDIRGVLGDYTAMQDATHNSGLYVGSGGAVALTGDMDQFARTQDEEIREEIQIAEDTGGIAEFNRNDIDGMLETAFEKSQSYYTVTYSPANKKWDGSYRKTSVSLNRKGTTVSYRGGYYAVDAPRAPKSVDDFTRAMRRGAPPAMGVLFTTALKKVDKKLLLDYVVDVDTLEFSSGEDVRTGRIDCAVVEYDRAGKVLGTAEIEVDGRVKRGEWRRLEETGFPAHQEIPLLADTATVVIGIRDHSSGEFGNMEVSVRP